VETWRLLTVTREQIQVQKVTCHWERKCKNGFRAYLRQKWIDLCHTKTKTRSQAVTRVADNTASQLTRLSSDCCYM